MDSAILIFVCVHSQLKPSSEGKFMKQNNMETDLIFDPTTPYIFCLLFPNIFVSIVQLQSLVVLIDWQKSSI